MGVWCSRCFQRVPIPRSQKIQKKHFTGFDSGDSGNAWFCHVFAYIFYAWNASDSHQSLGWSSKVSFSEHNLASLLQTTCSLPDGWRLISQMFNTCTLWLGRFAGMKASKKTPFTVRIFCMMTCWTDSGSIGFTLRFLVISTILLVALLSCLNLLCCPQWHFFRGSLRPAWWSCSRSHEQHATIGHTRPTCWSKRDRN